MTSEYGVVNLISQKGRRSMNIRDLTEENASESVEFYFLKNHILTSVEVESVIMDARDDGRIEITLKGLGTDDGGNEDNDMSLLEEGNDN